jgi:hypothetical protein
MYENVIRALGAVLENRSLYGKTHKVTVQSLEQAFEQISQTLATEDALLMAISPDELLINHQLVNTNVPLMQHFLDRLRDHELSTLTLSKELTPDEFVALIDLIAEDPATLAAAGGASSKLQSDAIFTHVQSRKVSYVELTDEEVVVKKEEIGDGGGRAARDTAVMEYLGVFEEEPPKPSDALGADLRDILDHPGEFGEVIIQAVRTSMDMELPAETPVPSATTKLLIERIVQCLERAFGTLKEDRSAKTQKGKKALIKSLNALGDELERVVRDAISPVEEEDLLPITNSIEDMTDELAIDALASEYLRKRKLIEDSEQRVLRYIARRGDKIEDSDLRAKLLDGGLPQRNWETLMIASGVRSIVSDGDSAVGAGLPGFKRLREMLGQLADCFRNIDSDDEAARKELQNLIEQVEERLERLVASTRQRMEHLSGQVAREGEDKEDGDTETPRPSRRQLLEMIAEIVQELCQPLSVVQCTIDVLMTEQIDTISDAQRNIVELAARSANRLYVLINELHDIVGAPSDLHPKAPAGKPEFDGGGTGSQP